MNSINRLVKKKAFTLLEVLITMVLSSFLMFAAIFGFTKINQFVASGISGAVEYAELLRLETNLRVDMSNALDVDFKGNKFVCNRISHNVMYDFTEGYVIRKQNSLLDTFYLSVTIAEKKYHPLLYDKVDCVIFDYNASDETMSFVLTRQYYLSSFFNEDIFNP